MKRDAALFLLGAWMLGTIAMALVALENFYTVDRLLNTLPNATFERGVHSLDAADGGSAREFLRYLSSELNRLFFMAWGVAEVALGSVLVALVWALPDRRLRWAVVGMLGLTVVLTFLVTPSIISVGRGLDFVPRDPAPPELSTFGLLHAAYTIGDAIKLAMGLGVAFWISRKR
jgi:hypothetical protein